MTHFGPAGAAPSVASATWIALLKAVPAPLPPSGLVSYSPICPRVTLLATVSTAARGSPAGEAGGTNVAAQPARVEVRRGGLVGERHHAGLDRWPS